MSFSTTHCFNYWKS